MVEGEIVTAIRELSNREWGARKRIAAELAIARNRVWHAQRGAGHSTAKSVPYDRQSSEITITRSSGPNVTTVPLGGLTRTP